MAVDAPCVLARFPSQTLDLLGEQRVCLRRIVTTNFENSAGLAISDGDDTSLMRFQIQLEGKLVGLAVIVQIVHLKRNFSCLQRGSILLQVSSVSHGDDQRPVAQI